MKLEQIIRLKFNNFKIDLPKKLEGDLEETCWPGYEAIGTKELDGKTVPNCVPIKEEQRTVKEGFPIPSPSGSEKEDEYISRCISAIVDEYPAEGQAYAVCKGEWDK